MAFIDASLNTLSGGIAEIQLDSHTPKTLIDTGRSQSFVSSNLLRRLGLNISSSSECVSMVSTEHHMEISGKCQLGLVMARERYRNVHLSLMKTYVLLFSWGITFLVSTRASIYLLAVINLFSRCMGLAAVSATPPYLFLNLPEDWHPIQDKSRRYCQSNAVFIKSEVKCLLKEDIIVPSSSPWRAQVLVVNIAGKKQTVVDYAQL